MRRLFTFFALSLACFAQGAMYPNGQLTPQQSVQIFNPPWNGTGAYQQWTDYQTALTSILTTGGVGFLNTGCTKASCTNLVFLDAGAGSDGTDWCPQPSSSIPNSGNGLDNWVTTTTANGNLANIVLAPTSYGNNSVTPAGIFGTSSSPGWARKLDTDCSGTKGSNGGIYSLTWQPNHRYFPGQYVFDTNTNAYWQIQTGCAVWTQTPTSYTAVNGVVTMTLGSTASILTNQYAVIATSDPRVNAAYVQVSVSGSTITYTVPGSTYTGSSSGGYNGMAFTGDVTGDAGCITGPGPTFTFSGSSTPDGTGVNTFNWTKTPDAPYQDVWVGPSFQGAANKAYSIPASTSTTSSCDGAGHCTLALQNPYIGTANADKVTVTGATGFTNASRLNCSGCLVTIIGATSITYQSPSGSTSGTLSAGTLTASRNMNMGMTNATISVIESGLPIPYEPPAFVANTYYCQWLFNHLAGNPKVGYIGCGGSIGGEDNTTGMTGSSGWRYGSESEYLDYQWARYGLFHTAAKAANILCRGNIFIYTFQQAYADWANSCSMGTNGYQMNDALAILAGNCLVVGAVQGDWCLLFNEYHNLAYPDWYGTFPLLELQFGSQLNNGQGTSTPGLDNAGNTGSLGTDPPSVAVPTSSNQDDTLTGWAFCNVSCAGGTGAGTSITQTINNSSPSLDGKSMQVGFTGPVLSPTQTTNVLWYDKIGQNNNATTFAGTWNVYVPSITNIAALEFDQFLFSNGQRFMFGSECDKGGFWRIWNQLAGSWNATSVSCTLLGSGGAWHSVQWYTHRVVGDTSCSGQPCMYYDILIVDGVSSTINTTYPSGTSSDPNNSGFQFQIDMDNTGGTTTAYLDQSSISIYTSTNPYCIGCPFQGLLPLAKAHYATDMEVYDACDNFLVTDPNYPAGCYIVNGNVDVTTGVATTHNGTGCTNTCVTYASIVAGDLVTIAGTSCNTTTPCTITAVTGSSFTVPASVTGVSNAAIKVYANAALYQIPGAAAFANFINFGYQIAGTGTGNFTWSGTSGGAPTFSRSATNIATAVAPPIIAPFTGLTGAGTYVTNPAPGNPSNIDNAPLLRVTDYNTSATVQKGFTSNVTGGASEQVFNNTSPPTWLVLADTGSREYFYNCNLGASPPTCGTPVFQGNTAKVPNQPEFSAVDPNKFYYLGNAASTGDGFFIYTQSVLSPGNPTTFFDLTTCNGWNGANGTSASPPRHNHTDLFFTTGASANGGQGTGRQWITYVPPGGVIAPGCYLVDSGTTAMYGPSGLIGHYNPSHGTFTIHQIEPSMGDTPIAFLDATNNDQFKITSLSYSGGLVTMAYTPIATGSNTTGISLITGESITITATTNYNGTYTLLSATSSTATWAKVCSLCINESSGTVTVNTDNGANTPFMWLAGSSDLVSQCPAPSLCGGHHAMGSIAYYNNYDHAVFGQRLYSNPTVANITFPSPNPCTVPSGAVDDWHGFMQYSPSDTNYLIGASDTGSNQPTYTWPCQNEVLGFLANATPSVKRFSFTYQVPTWNFSACNGISNVSYDQNWVMFSSTMNDSLGTMTGGTTVTHGTVCNGPENGTGGNARPDVFLVDLRSQ